jgi:hypothetical protein
VVTESDDYAKVQLYQIVRGKKSSSLKSFSLESNSGALKSSILEFFFCIAATPAHISNFFDM